MGSARESSRTSSYCACVSHRSRGSRRAVANVGGHCRAIRRETSHLDRAQARRGASPRNTRGTLSRRRRSSSRPATRGGGCTSPALGSAAPEAIGNGLLALDGDTSDSRAVRQLLRRWLTERATEVLAPTLHALARELGFDFERVLIRRQRSRWGSCSTRGTISLNCCLMFQRPQVVRYLMIHELSHTRAHESLAPLLADGGPALSGLPAARSRAARWLAACSILGIRRRQHGMTENGRSLRTRRIHWELGSSLSYGEYLQLDKILDAQKPLTYEHDEMMFIIVHQSSELWMRLMLHELRGVLECVRRDDLDPSFKMLARVSHVQTQLIATWDVLSTMTPFEYSAFRNALGRSSGFQSVQYRMLEFLLGNKHAQMIEVHKRDPQGIRSAATRAGGALAVRRGAAAC